MSEIIQKSLAYHQGGKIAVTPKTSLESFEDLSLAYSPGVAYPCLEIQANPLKSYDLTSKSNLVAVISNGTAVLGLGDIGAEASKPVMEGKSVLFKKFAKIDSFDIEINEKDPQKLISIIKAIAPTFGGINLEDIKAPECFEIERALIEELDIPVMHDDQHGTAIVSTAALLNASKIVNKELQDLKVVIIGAGASAISCAKMYKSFGVQHIHMFDSQGLINHLRSDLTPQKQEFISQKTFASYQEALKGADVLLGLSRANILTQEDIKEMAPNPLLFVLSNPNPEIAPELIKEVRPDAIVATGRSDYPNQINNVLAFPYLFRGALDVRASKITENMKKACSIALAQLAQEEVPQELCKLYQRDLSFGKDYIIPMPFDLRLLPKLSEAVAQSAKSDGVARI
ncbi:malic enzyme-like NAD(P)-binding protein [Helicobacter kayseriensis]|uniref:malic enzyme-like NAD(P)-binding protein n=1 Tax=Helicobacter kayseriensis TaxID=2905877 RepID=UPI001E327DEC|nr:malic enzyme-like NAD(P)-binding protein [Helicobacter kayseriensis]MCE3047596.1 malate dehydrogenase [Helicobacter kayseriensis]MCE3048967.1 malate dehydrogenase [Helicobacter kayseriensis]